MYRRRVARVTWAVGDLASPAEDRAERFECFTCAAIRECADYLGVMGQHIRRKGAQTRGSRRCVGA
jgi:hypothetical protein